MLTTPSRPALPGSPGFLPASAFSPIRLPSPTCSSAFLAFRSSAFCLLAHPPSRLPRSSAFALTRPSAFSPSRPSAFFAYSPIRLFSPTAHPPSRLLAHPPSRLPAHPPSPTRPSASPTRPSAFSPTRSSAFSPTRPSAFAFLAHPLIPALSPAHSRLLFDSIPDPSGGPPYHLVIGGAVSIDPTGRCLCGCRTPCCHRRQSHQRASAEPQPRGHIL